MITHAETGDLATCAASPATVHWDPRGPHDVDPITARCWEDFPR